MMAGTKYQAKPQVVEAWQVTDDEDENDLLMEELGDDVWLNDDDDFAFETPGGTDVAGTGDWIVRGATGGLSRYSAAEFAANFEAQSVASKPVVDRSALAREVFLSEAMGPRDGAIAAWEATPSLRASFEYRADRIIASDIVQGAVAPAGASKAIGAISAEVERHTTEVIFEEASDPGHPYRLASAARSYVTAAEYRRTVKPPEFPPMSWPFGPTHWDPSGDAARDLTTAGALIVRAIDALLADDEERSDA